MKIIALILLSFTLNAVEFETAIDALKAGNAAVEVLLANDNASVDTVVIPQAKVLRDASRFFQAHADDDFSEEQMDQISVIQKSLHNCRMLMNGDQMVQFNTSSVAMVKNKPKAVAKK